MWFTHAHRCLLRVTCLFRHKLAFARCSQDHHHWVEWLETHWQQQKDDDLKCDRNCGPDLSWHRSEMRDSAIIISYYIILYPIFGIDLCGENDIPARLGWFRGTWLSFHDIFLAGPWISWRSPIESPSIRLQSPILAVGENWILQNWLVFQHVKTCQQIK
jgi:hypothetical protein